MVDCYTEVQDAAASSLSLFNQKSPGDTVLTGPSPLATPIQQRIYFLGFLVHQGLAFEVVALLWRSAFCVRDAHAPRLGHPHK